MRTDPQLSRKIRLYIQEDMSVNAFVFGKKTLVLTRGSVALLSDDCLKGLMAHEFGHFAHYLPKIVSSVPTGTAAASPY